MKLLGNPKSWKLLQKALLDVWKGNNIIPHVIMVVLMGWLAASRCMMWCLTRLPQACRTSPNWVSTNQALLLLLFNHISISAPNCEVNLSSLHWHSTEVKWYGLKCSINDPTIGKLKRAQFISLYFPSTGSRYRQHTEKHLKCVYLSKIKTKTDQRWLIQKSWWRKMKQEK